jgi:hypothetical protein
VLPAADTTKTIPRATAAAIPPASNNLTGLIPANVTSLD